MGIVQAVIGWTLALGVALWNTTIGLPTGAGKLVCAASQTVVDTVQPVTTALTINR